MIRILDRLIFSTFLQLFVLVLVAAQPLFIIGDLAENLDDFIDRGLTGAEVFQSYMYMVPLFIQWTFPLGALLATVFTVHMMTVHREVVAAKAGGISFHRLFLPLLVAGFVLTGVALALSEIVPRTNRIAAQLQRAEVPGRSWRSDFVYRSEDGMSWQVERLTAADGRMTGVILERPPSHAAGGLHLAAEAASYDEDEGWELAQGYLRRIRQDTVMTTVEFDRITVRGLAEEPDELLEVPPEPEEMTYAEIDRLARIIQRSGGDANELLVKKEQKIAIPVMTLVIILFGAPLATSSRRGGAAFGIGLSLATVLVFMMLLRVSAALGEAGALAPLTAAWLPNAVFAVAGIVFTVRVRT
jgi:lipopolysaccharide export system permease protein